MCVAILVKMLVMHRDEHPYYAAHACFPFCFSILAHPTELPVLVTYYFILLLYRL